MSTADDVVDAELVEAPLLPLLDWLPHQALKERTVRRYLAEGRYPAARKDTKGFWYLPLDAELAPRPLEAVPAVPARPSSQLARLQDTTDTRPWLRLGELAELLGLSEHNLRQWAARGQLDTRTGPHGATIVLRGELVRLLGPIR